MDVGQLAPGLGHVHNKIQKNVVCPFFLLLFTPRDAPLDLIAIKTKCPSEAIWALCGPYVWVLIERGLLCLGHR